MGSTSVLPSIWPLARDCIDASAIVSLQQVSETIRQLLTSNHIVAEGAGAVPVAAALAGRAGGGKLVCIVSGGNLGEAELASILAGAIPEQRAPK
jgi:threonine dehydratase